MDEATGAAERLRARRVGLWTASLEVTPATGALELARQIEAMGFGSLWIPEAYGRDALTHALALATATSSLVVGTGIANIYARGAMTVAAASRLVEALAPGRFVLGLGVSHQPLVERDRHQVYGPPLAAMEHYLQELHAAPYFAADPQLPPIVLAALGPKMLELARDMADGAHPYLVMPSHTEQARAALGEGPLLVVEQAVVVNCDREESLRRAHEHLSIYSGLPNYQNSWFRQGFTEADVVRGGSDRLADALVVQGGVEAVFARVEEHLEAGADHVALQVLGPSLVDVPRDDWQAIGEALDRF